MKTVLLVTNRLPDEAGGRAGKIETRQRLFEDRGWRVEFSYVLEPYIRSFPRALLRARRRAKEVDPDVVISMNNPFHMHLIGYAAARRVDAPWVAEFRDPILTHPDWDEGSLLRRAAGFVERFTVARANRVVWLDGIQLPDEYFEETYPDLPGERFVKLPFMGYEVEPFQDADPAELDGFTITYAGSFYEGWIEPYDFLKGLGRYLEDDASDDVVAHFFGDWNEDYEVAANEAGVSEELRTHGFVPHEEVVPALLGSNVLLYVGGDDPKNRLNVPSKIWDYVGARRPILAIVDPDFRVAEFVREHELGLVAPPGDPSAIEDAIAALHDGSFEYDPDSAVFDRFTRSRHVGAYVDVLETITTAGPSQQS